MRKNEYRIDNNVATIICSNGTQTFIDVCDLEKIRQHQWFTGHSGYICTKINANGKRCNLELHRFILCPDENERVDHISGDRLDNRRVNLRLCSHQQNTFNKGLQKNNTTGFKGVSFYKPSGKYMAGIRANGKTQYLGLYTTATEAAHAYDVAARRFFGDFAWLNFPYERREQKEHEHS